MADNACLGSSKVILLFLLLLTKKLVHSELLLSILFRSNELFSLHSSLVIALPVNLLTSLFAQLTEGSIVDEADLLVIWRLQDSYNNVSLALSGEGDWCIQNLRATLFEYLLDISVSAGNSDSTESFTSINLINSSENKIYFLSSFEVEVDFVWCLGSSVYQAKLGPVSLGLFKVSHIEDQGPI